MYLSSENVDSWQFETIRDFVELCDARLALPESPENKQMRVEIEKAKIEYERIITRHGRRKEGAARAVHLASQVGLKVDHAAFFKFMTKIVHPSGYLVNKPEVAGAYENRVLMIWYAQISARHIYEQVKRRYFVPGKWPEPSQEYVGGA